MLDAKTMAVAANIRKIREYKNYTQDYLAAKLGISQNAFSKIELGYSNITIGRLCGIAAILEVDLIAMLKFDDEETMQSELVEVTEEVKA